MDFKKAIKAQGFTLDAVAKEMQGREGAKGITRAAMSQLINGNPSISKLKEIADIIGVPLWDLIRQAENDQQPAAGVPVCPRCGAPLVISITTPAGLQDESSTHDYDQTTAAAVQDDRGHAAPLP